jgi:hypothetical protein
MKASQNVKPNDDNQWSHFKDRSKKNEKPLAGY